MGTQKGGMLLVDEKAIDRVMAGPEKKHRAMNDNEKNRVAFHESGHALVAKNLPTAEPIHKVSIIPRGVAALGYTLQLPVTEKFLSTKQEMKEQITILLGCRSAEEIVFHDVSSGAQNDLERATEIAHSMVCQLGMSERLGPLTYGKQQRLMYLDVAAREERNFSEETARLIDEEIKNLVEEGHQQAMEIISSKRNILDKLASRLLEKEVLSGEEVEQIVKTGE